MITNLRVDLVLGSVRRRRSVLLLVTLESVSGLGWAGWAGEDGSRHARLRPECSSITFHCSLIPVLSTHHTALSPDIKCADFLEVEFSGALITVGSVLLGWLLVVTAGCNVVSVSPVF